MELAPFSWMAGTLFLSLSETRQLCRQRLCQEVSEPFFRGYYKLIARELRKKIGLLSEKAHRRIKIYKDFDTLREALI